jgi:ribosomal protein S18 acetylase RimI-like enzyme
MPLTVRSAQDTDEDAVVALWRASDLVAGDKDPSADFQFARLGASSDVLVGVDEAGQVKASVMVGHDGHRGWLYYVAADPNARGQGLGRQIVKAAEEWLSDRGVSKAQLLVLTTNQTVVDFYDRLGFSVSPRIVMSKVLLKGKPHEPGTVPAGAGGLSGRGWEAITPPIQLAGMAWKTEDDHAILRRDCCLECPRGNRTVSLARAGRTRGKW